MFTAFPRRVSCRALEYWGHKNAFSAGDRLGKLTETRPLPDTLFEFMAAIPNYVINVYGKFN